MTVKELLNAFPTLNKISFIHDNCRIESPNHAVHVVMIEQFTIQFDGLASMLPHSKAGVDFHESEGVFESVFHGV